MLIEIYTKTQVAQRYYLKKGIELDPIPAYKKFYQDKKINFKLLEEVIDEGYAIQKSMLKEAKKRKK